VAHACELVEGHNHEMGNADRDLLRRCSAPFVAWRLGIFIIRQERSLKEALPTTGRGPLRLRAKD
jgi:hypothetical protein